MAIHLSIQYQELENKLSQLQYKLSNTHELMSSIAISLLQTNQARHLKEVNPTGEKWARLKPATIAKKTNKRMLVQYGGLLNFYNQVNANTAYIGTNNFKAPYFQFGTNHMPARQIVGFPLPDEQLTTNLTTEYLKAIF